MVSEVILDRLLPITEEEQKILDGLNSIDKSIYMDIGSNVINSKKLMELGKLISICKHPRFIAFPLHSHDYIEVTYMCSGSTTHIINGSKLVLSEGDLLFLNMSAVHEIESTGKEDIAVNFIILPQFFDNVLTLLGEEETPLKSFIIDSLSKKDNKISYLHFKIADILPIQNLIENLVYNLIFDVPNTRNVNQKTMGLLLLQLINHTDKLDVSYKNNTLLVEVFRYIEENYADESLEKLAKKLHYNLYWLSREIRRHTGRTYTELLQEKRLSQAAFLLKTTKISIAEVAFSVGYKNLSYFHRIFSKRFGLSPSKYRNRK